MAKQYSQEQRNLYFRIEKTVMGQAKTLIHQHPEYFDKKHHGDIIHGLAKRIANDLVSGHNLHQLKIQIIMMAKKEYEGKKK